MGKGKSVIGIIRETLNEIRGKGSADSVEEFSSVEDSLRQKARLQVDSLNSKLEGVTERIPTEIDLDSLNPGSWGEDIIQKADSIQHAPDAVLSTVEQKLNKPQNILHQKTDSLTSLLEKPARVVNEKIDSTLNKINTRIDALERKVLGTVEKTESKLQEKVNSVTQDEVNIPGLDKTNIPEIDIGDAEISTQGLTGNLGLAEDLDVEIPGLDTESLELQLPEIEIPDVNQQLDVPDVGDIKAIGDVKSIDAVDDVSGGLDDVDRQLAELEKYEEELRKAKEADLAGLEKRTEQELMKIDEAGGVAGEIQKAAAEQARYEAMARKYSDKKILEEEIRRKAKNVVTDEINHLSPAFKEAQEKIAANKKKYDEVLTMKDLPKRRSNDMRNKTFYQRLLPGVTLQVYGSDKILVDAGVQVGYRFTERLTAGLGGVYRIAISDEYRYLVRDVDIFGGRTYVDWNFRKALYLHGEFEALRVNADPVTPQPTANEKTEDHAYNAYGGIGTSFNISRRVKGSVLGLYRFELDGYVPNFNKVSVRLGFHYDLARRKKQRP